MRLSTGFLRSAATALAAIVVLSSSYIAGAKQSAQDTAVIAGRVLRSGTQEPIPNVQITLLKSRSGVTTYTAETVSALDSIQQMVSGAPRGISRAYLDSLIAAREQALGLSPGTFELTSQTTVLTDASGQFSFKDQAPGIYGVRAALDGYFGPPINGVASTTVTKSVTVEAQKPVPSTNIFMFKGGAITGRVRDPEGQPVSGMNVSAMRLSYSNGRPQWTAAVSKTTNERGEFRIFWVSPGEYYVAVTPPGANSRPGAQDSWVRTFFPGVADPAAAGVLAVMDGAEIPGIDFSIQTAASTPTFKIRGRAINPLALPNATTGVVDRNVNTFILSPREPGTLGSVNPPTVQNSVPPAARPNGEFEIRNVRPGSYDLFAYSMAPAPVPAAGTPSGPPFRRYYIDRAWVDIQDSDVEGIMLQIQKGTEISGKVVLQGNPPLPMDKIRISLRSLDAMPDAFAIIVGSIPVASSGDFSAPDIPPAQYGIQISGLPDTAYVADVQQGGISVFNTGFTTGKQPAIPLEIVVNGNGGIIEGNVRTTDRKPVPGSMVVLVPPVADRRNTMRYKTATTDDEGNFSMKGVAPGQYSLFAWESVPPTAWMNSDFLAKYQDSGRQVFASQGSQLNVQLDLIPSGISRR
jgi:hypothetical protein